MTIASRKRWLNSENGRAWAKKYRAKPEQQAKRAKSNAAHRKKMKSTDEGRAALAASKKKYRDKPEVKERYVTYMREDHLKRNFGISIAEYDALLVAQGGVCAICKRDPKSSRGHGHLDHDHVTRVIRGILCSRCNQALGLLRDDPSVFRSAAEYLEASVSQVPLLPIPVPASV